MIDFIHVGDFKTGTSWLQRYFYSIHPEINYLGGPFENHELEHLLHVLIDSRDLDFNGVLLRKNISGLITNDKEKKITGICREVFSGSNYISCNDAKQNAERLFEVFEPVKIIYVIREQLDMIRSIYSQYLKMGGTLDINNFIFDPIVSRGLIERLKWHKQIQMYYDIFGKDNVHIGLYEEFKHDKIILLSKLCVFLGIKEINYNYNDKIVNKGLTNIGASFARFGNRFFRSHYNNSHKIKLFKNIIKFITKSDKLREIQADTENRIIPSYEEFDLTYRTNYALNSRGVSFVRRIAGSIKLGKSLTIPEQQVPFLKEQFINSNKKLLHDINLPIDKYNYSL